MAETLTSKSGTTSSPIPAVRISTGDNTLGNDSYTIISINVAAQAPLKLTATNDSSWKAQFNTLLIGYDLYGFVDGSYPCPPNRMANDAPTKLNPEYSYWIRQDSLILNALLASLSDSITSYISSSKTSREAWVKLATMYAKPSHSRIMTLQESLMTLSQGSLSITEYM